MKHIDHWSAEASIAVAESAGGVLATVRPMDNLIRGGVSPWPTPELMQKLNASDLWKGKTAEDNDAVRVSLGHYCNLQSLNSEDAITWSVLGPVIYGPTAWREQFAASFLDLIGLSTTGTAATVWLWRRIPHPEKPLSNGGPEIDFGVQTENCLVLGEAKWNSSIGTGQGVAHNRTQLDLRLAYCLGLGMKAAASPRRWAVVGVGRKADVLTIPATSSAGAVTVRNLSWSALIRCLPSDLQAECTAYLAWKERHSSNHPRSLAGTMWYSSRTMPTDSRA